MIYHYRRISAANDEAVNDVIRAHGAMSEPRLISPPHAAYHSFYTQLSLMSRRDELCTLYEYDT